MNAKQEDVARGRFFILSAVRISGAAMIVFALAIISRGLLDLPKEAGYVLLVAGISEFIFAPLMLARAWKSKPDL